MPGGTSAIEGSVGREIASRANEKLTTIWVADQQHDPASWLLGHSWTTEVSRASWVASAYGRPMTDLQPQNLRVVQLVTGEFCEWLGRLRVDVRKVSTVPRPRHRADPTTALA